MLQCKDEHSRKLDLKKASKEEQQEEEKKQNEKEREGRGSCFVSQMPCSLLPEHSRQGGEEMTTLRREKRGRAKTRRKTQKLNTHTDGGQRGQDNLSETSSFFLRVSARHLPLQRPRPALAAHNKTKTQQTQLLHMLYLGTTPRLSAYTEPIIE